MIRKFEKLDIAPFFNNRGTTREGEYKSGALSLGRSSLPAEQVPFGQEFYVNGVPFQIIETKSGDNLELEGQTISFSAAAVHTVHVLGCSSNSDLFDFIYFLREGELVNRSRLFLSDFAATKASFGEQSALTFTHLHTQGGPNRDYRPVIWHTSIELPYEMIFDGIRFEDNANMHVFALTFERIIE